MLLFEPEVFKKKLLSAEEAETYGNGFFMKTDLPPSAVEKFHKIMVAHTREDLDDISIEDIIDAFDHIEELEEYYTESTSHTNRSLPACLKRLKSLNSATVRRVL